eukprot:602495-Prorocentrum_minimum.AAC.1
MCGQIFPFTVASTVGIAPPGTSRPTLEVTARGAVVVTARTWMVLWRGRRRGPPNLESRTPHAYAFEGPLPARAH